MAPGGGSKTISVPSSRRAAARFYLRGIFRLSRRNIILSDRELAPTYAHCAGLARDCDPAESRRKPPMAAVKAAYRQPLKILGNSE
jgi:hypothetical protein